MKSLVDEWVDKGARKWMREGMRKGEKQNALKIAKRMKARGDSIDEIIKMTDLTVDDVLKL
jgi:predicted transposase/invertase (TIGR01784 family)